MKGLIVSLALIFTGSAYANIAQTVEEVRMEASSRKIIPADYMLCKDVIQQYETTGRIWVIAHGKDIVPIYGMKPISQRGSYRCKGRGKSMPIVYFANTRDTDYCGFALYC